MGSLNGYKKKTNHRNFIYFIPENKKLLGLYPMKNLLPKAKRKKKSLIFEFENVNKENTYFYPPLKTKLYISGH